MARPLLFYSAWPLDYHNLEAARKARGFAAGGYDTVYVAGIGIRNPRPATLAKAVDRVARKVRRVPDALGDGDGGLRTASLVVVPPRQVGLVRQLNAAWVRRQLVSAVGGPGSVVWARWPTPELIDALDALDPAAVIYECVDAYHHTPGIVGPWAPRFAAAEAALVERADVVVVPGDHLAERFGARGTDVRVITHGVDLEVFPYAPPRPRTGPEAVVGFVGTLDYKIDIAFLRHAAERHPEWRIRLIGPIQEGFDPGALADLGNVSVEPAIPYAEVGGAIASFDASMMPYFDAPTYRSSVPLKNFEIMAVGRPAAGRPTRALEAYRDLVYLADTPEAFVAGLERALAEDSATRARARRSVAEHNTWAAKIDEMLILLESLQAGPGPVDHRDRPET
jgi:glycosyltransferase involved in cell wall biosynthesis